MGWNIVIGLGQGGPTLGLGMESAFPAWERRRHLNENRIVLGNGTREVGAG